MWADAIARGRRLVSVRAFCESHGTQTIVGDKIGKPVRRQHHFLLTCSRAFLLAGVEQDGMLFIVAMAPNSAVTPVHDRMPLVLGPGESNIWSARSSPSFQIEAESS